MSVKCHFIGRLGADAELVTLSEKPPFISCRLAVNEKIQGKEVTTWMGINADYNRFKNMYPYLKKGGVLSVSGTEHCSLYQSKEGKPGIDRKVSVDSLEFVNLGRKDDNATTTNSANAAAAATMTTGTLHSAQAATMTTGTLHSAQPTPAATTVSDDLPF